jgi:hypothetical protein
MRPTSPLLLLLLSHLPELDVPGRTLPGQWAVAMTQYVRSHGRALPGSARELSCCYFHLFGSLIRNCFDNSISLLPD